MKPMLAKHWNDFRSRTPFPLYVQPKLDGVRALYNQGTLQSRDENIWAPPVVHHILSFLEGLPANFVLDGELYLHGKSRQQINSAVGINRIEPSDQSTSIQYHVFDLFDGARPDLNFSDRLWQLHYDLELLELPDSSPIKLVPTHLAFAEEEADRWFLHYKSLNYEGIMYRKEAPYGLLSRCGNQENRWDVLLKRKNRLEGEYQIADVFEEIDKHGTPKGRCGGLTLIGPEGRFFNCSGLTDLEKDTFWNAPPRGRLCEITYDVLSDSGVPLQPSFENLI